MIIIGGQIPNASLTECDVPKIGGQHGLLLGQEATEQGVWWHAIQDNTTGYRVPDKIVALVGGEYVLEMLSYDHLQANMDIASMATLRQQHLHKALRYATYLCTSEGQPPQHHAQRRGSYQQRQQRVQRSSQNPHRILVP